MLKTLFGKTFASGEAKPQPAEGNTHGKLDLDRLKALLEFFPIGKKLRYCPEFKKEIILDTVIVGYCVNGEFIYSGEAIERDAQGYPSLFHTSGIRGETPVAKLNLFQLLVPDTSNLELKLDYPRRALLGRGRQFIKGNDISLISVAGAKGLAKLDTEVAKRLTLEDGPYAHSDMILLTPELNSLTVSDQRTKARTKIHVPATLFLLKEQISGLCTIIDVSESAVRVLLQGGLNTAMPGMNKKDEVIIDIILGESEQRYTIKGSVIASRTQEICVIQMDGLVKGGKLSNLEPLDRMELKARLLSYVQ